MKRSPPEAVRNGGALAEAYADGVAEMTRLNDVACRLALELGADAATDVTGFGLLGHLHEMASASGLAAVVESGAVPLLPDARRLLVDGHVPGGTLRNVDHLAPHLDGGDGDTRILLADAQTSGGLLVALPGDRADVLTARLIDAGHRAARIGELTAGSAGRITIVA